MAQPKITIRPAQISDAPVLATLLNEIIEIGGTTAHETPLDETAFANIFLRGQDFICCFVAEDADGQAAGFQALERHPKLPSDWGDIATFARVSPKMPGVGTALFPHTLKHAREAGLAAINATIRADNTGGLAYYDKMGFVTHRVDKAVPLGDGTPVDRISKKFVLD